MPIAEIDNGSTVEYDQADTISVRMVTNSSGNAIEQQGDYPYGEMWYQSATNTDFEFSNYLRDSESGNDYAYAREYVNRLARFSTLDPVGGNVGNPLSWDRYPYTLDDPVNLVDPTGACASGSPCGHGSAPPAPFAGAPNPGGLVDCTLDGVYTSCGFAEGQYAQGNAGLCLNAGCTIWAIAGGQEYEAGHYEMVSAGQREGVINGVFTAWFATKRKWVPLRPIGPSPDYGLPVMSAEDQQVQALADAIVQKAGYLDTWQFWGEWTGLTVAGGSVGYAAYDASLVEEGQLFGTRLGGNAPLFNSNGALRVGWSYSRLYGEYVFRIGGSVLGWLFDNPHINLWPPSWWFGPPGL